MMLMSLIAVIPAAEAHVEAKKALATATELEGESADSLHANGMIIFSERDWHGSVRAFQQAIDAKPDHVQATSWLGMVNGVLGRHEEAIVAHEQARSIDPLAPYPYGMSGMGFVMAGRAEESEQYFQHALDFEAQNTLALWGYSMALVRLGRQGEAIAMAEKAVALSRRAPLFVGVLGWALASAGRIDDARTIREELGARPASDPTPVSEVWLLAEQGEIDAAFQLLEKARDEGQMAVSLIGLPGFDRLRADSRFTRFTESLGL